ncbi:MAG: IS21 family transposase [Acidimicrobiales bacterium]
MRKIRDVLRLTSEGLSLREVARSLQIPHTTVADHLKRARAAGLTWPLPEDLDDAGLEAALFSSGQPVEGPRPLPDWEKVHKELARPHVTLMLVWLEYREDFPDGYAYSRFCELYRDWRGHLGLSMRQAHKAGEKLFVDFPGRRLPIYDEVTGEVAIHAELFVAVLGASGYLYAEAFPSQELMYWVTAHVHTFEFLRGCPALCVCDNLRSGVTSPHRYEPDVNATYQEMAAHYGVAILPARSYKPKDKSKAEGGVLLAERWIMARLRNRTFTSIAEANQAIWDLVKWLNARPFKKMEGCRESVFEEVDRPALRALPPTRYDFATWSKAKVSIDYHVEVRGKGRNRHYYSVPYRLVGEVVDVRISAGSVEVFHRHRRVASHVRSYGPGHTTDRAHMPESHRRHAEWTPSRIASWANKAGPDTAKLVEAVMASRPHPEQGFRSCLGIIRLGSRYGNERLEAACRRALAIRAHSYRSVESILKAGLDRKPLPAKGETGGTHPDHANLRGPGYYQ